MTNSTTPHLHDKWMAMVIWLALLVAVIYTSTNGTVLSYAGSLTNYLRNFATADLLDNPFRAPILLVVIGGLICTGLFIHQLVTAWLKFAELTRDLVVAYAKMSQGEAVNTIFMDWLIFSNAVEVNSDETAKYDEVDPDEAESSAVSDILRPLAFAWALILIAPPLLSLVVFLG